jgi:hypothetical protein
MPTRYLLKNGGTARRKDRRGKRKPEIWFET